MPYIAADLNVTKVRLTDANRTLYPDLKSNEGGARVYGGMRFLRQLFGVEFGVDAVHTIRLTEGKTLQISNVTLDMMFFLPLSRGVDMFGGIGLGHLRTKIKGNLSESNTRIRWKTGFEFPIDYYLAGRLTYTYQDSNANKMPLKRMNQFGIGLIYRFK